MPLTAPPSAPPAAPAAPGDAPSRANPSSFRSLADAFVVWQVGFRNSMASLRTWLADYITWAGTHVSEMDALQSDVSTKAAQVSTDAGQVSTDASTVAGIAAAFGNVDNAVFQAGQARDDAQGSAAAASASAAASQSARSASEAARDTAAALVNRRTDVAAALADASIPVGGWFSTPSTNSDEAAIVYQKVAGPAAVESTRIVSVFAVQDFRDDAGALVSAQVQAVALGLVDADRITAFTNAGVFIDLLNGVYRLGRTTKSGINRFTQLVVARAASAYAYDNTAHLQSFTANTLRATNRGALIEASATNQVAAPSDFVTGWGTFGGAGQATVNANAGAAPDGTITADDLVEGASAAYRSYAINLAVGTWTASLFLEKQARRYAMVEVSGGGLVGVANYVLDFDAGTFALATGAANNATPTVERLYGNVYRVKLTFTTVAIATTTVAVRGANGTAYADRAYANVAGTVYARAWHFQIESGSSASSPCTGTRPADSATLDLSGIGTGGSDTVTVEWEGGSTTFLRSSLALLNSLNLVTDGGGAWLTKYITRITLVPAAAVGYRSHSQADDDHSAALVASSIRPLNRAVRQALATLGMRQVPMLAGSNYDLVGSTENHSVPYMVASGGVYFWDGQMFGSESTMLAAMGATSGSGVVTLPGYVAPDAVDILGGVTFTSTLEGFTNASNATVTLSGGTLKMTPTGTPGSFSRSMSGYAGKALKLSVSAYRTAAGAMLPVFSETASDLSGGTGGGVAPLNTPAVVDVICTPRNGFAWWVGGLFGGGAIGDSFWDNPTLKEIAPARDFPNGNFWMLWEGSMPNPLPGTTQVIAQGDIGSELHRWRIELRAGGAVWLKSDVFFGTGAATFTQVQIGTVTAGQAVKIAAGASRTQLLGAVNGSGAETDLVGLAGFSSFRMGANTTGGEAFTGTRTAYSVYSGIETLSAMKRMSRISTASSEIHVDGDSYSIAGSTGIALMLGDLGYQVQPTGVGGSTMLEQRDRIIANAALYDLPLVWWDGSPNGHTTGQYAIDLGYIDSVVAAIGHSRWLWVRNGQIGGGADLTDMTNLFNAVAAKYGSVHVYDPVPVINSFAITDSANVGYANDQADLAAGKYPRSTLYDAVHLRPDVRRAVALDMQKAIEKIRRL